mgnify:CR=1 FL=1
MQNTTTPQQTNEVNEVAPKKAYKMPKSLKAKCKANNEWKKSVFSLTGLYKYMQGEGKTHVENYLKNIDSDLQVEKITKKAIIDNLSDFERFKALKNENGETVKDEEGKTVLNKEERKTEFKFYTLLNCVGRIAKNQK